MPPISISEGVARRWDECELCSRGACAGSVAHQPTGFGIVTQRIYRGEPMERRQLGQLTRRPLKKGSPGTKRASGRSRAKVAKAASISRMRAGGGAVHSINSGPYTEVPKGNVPGSGLARDKIALDALFRRLKRAALPIR
jgi:hypothetical protein